MCEEAKLRVDEGMERCIHCWGSGEEPFSDGERCGLCVGECTIPRELNKRYYDIVREALDDAE